MAKEFFPEEDENAAQKKSSQQRLLLLLLLLIILFAYLYFFTGLIKPRGEEASVPPPPPAPVVVKKPLPPRSTSAEATADKPTSTSAEATADKPASTSANATAGKPAAAPGGAPAKPEAAAKPAVPAAKPQAAVKPAAPASPAKPAPAKEAKAAPAKEAKPAAAANKAKAAPAKTAKPAAVKEAKSSPAKEAKPAAKSPAKAKAYKSPVASAKGAFALELDHELAESEVPSVTSKLKKAGLSRVVTIKAHKGEPMHRLFLADFASRDEAAEELGRLRSSAPNAFMLKENGRYAVYAGSFMREGKAAVEQDRLYDKGVRLVLKKANIPVTVVRVRAGSFPDPRSAEKAAAGLKKSGLTAKVVKAGK